MKIQNVPTGQVIIIDGQKGKLECLSIADYGKEANIKADFLGITRPLLGVPNGQPLPLTEKWVVTISSQYGCSMGCKFCDVPKVGPGRNASVADMNKQVAAGLLVGGATETKRLNVHYARMGEPTFNRDTLRHALGLRYFVSHDLGVQADTIHPVISTMMPHANTHLQAYLTEWCYYVKNDTYGGEAGLQLSINSTCDKQREEMFSGSSSSLARISYLADKLPKPRGRKYALNFAVADGYEISGKKLADLFDPTRWMVKLTPIHNTAASTSNSIGTKGGYSSFTPYEDIEQDLISNGFDVLTFVPSEEEERGMITCGNALLAHINH